MWDGGTARQIGLVDGFGGMEEAIAKAAQLAKLGDDRSVRYLDAPRSYREELIETFASRDSDNQVAPNDAFAALAGRPEIQLGAALADVRNILTGPSIQARCLECGAALPPAKPTRADLSLFALIREWLS